MQGARPVAVARDRRAAQHCAGRANETTRRRRVLPPTSGLLRRRARTTVRRGAAETGPGRPTQRLHPAGLPAREGGEELRARNNVLRDWHGGRHRYGKLFQAMQNYDMNNCSVLPILLLILRILIESVILCANYKEQRNAKIELKKLKVLRSALY